MSIEIQEYLSADGAAPFTDWLDQLRDGMARVRVVKRLTRLRAGLMAGLSDLLRPPWFRAHRAAGWRRQTDTAEGH